MKPEMMKFDFKQQKDAPEVLDLYVYSDVAPDGYDWWTGQAVKSETSQNYFRDQLSQFGDVKKINLYINSSGGSVSEGYGIYAQLKRHPAQKTVYVDGFANSIASIIAMCGDNIIMRINSIMGIHNMMTYCFGNAAEHRKCAEDLDRMMEGNRQIYLARSGGKITLEKLTELMDAETFLTAQECLEYGFCDEIVEQDSDDPKAVQALSALNEGMEQQIAYFRHLKRTFAQAMDVINDQNRKQKENPDVVQKIFFNFERMKQNDGT